MAGGGGGGGVAESTASVSESSIEYVVNKYNVDGREVLERGWMRDWVRRSCLPI